MTGFRRVALTVTLALLLITEASPISYVSANSFQNQTTQSQNAQCTLSILHGSVLVKMADSIDWVQGFDGMSLFAGAIVETTDGSHALLTFLDGSTLTLEDNTVIEIQQVNIKQNHRTISLKQWIGRTWSRVTKMLEPGSYYEIQTPSAVVLVRGTMFSTEVDSTGATEVQTSEGLVSVCSEGSEVYVSAGEQTTVESGMPPSEPTQVNPTSSQGQSSSSGKDQSNNKDQSHGQNQGNNQDISHDQINNKHQNNGRDQNQSNSQDLSGSQDQGTSQDLRSNQDLSSSQGQDSSQDQNSSQDISQDPSSSQDLSNSQDQDNGHGQGNGHDGSQDQGGGHGQGNGHDGSQDQGGGHGQGNGHDK